MGDRIEQNDQIYSGDYMPNFFLEEDMQSQTLDSNLAMGSGHDMPLDSTIPPFYLRMTSTTFDSLISNNDHPNVPQPTNEKFKASNFSMMSIKIGSWEKYSRYEYEMVAKYYYAKKKIVWEFLDCALKNKIEIQFSDIDAMRAVIIENQPETLEILLNHHPLFFRETTPLPKKHTIWHSSSDFTGGQALSFRKHCVKFPPGTLGKHYAKLLQSDSRLLNISKKPFPNMDFPYFQSINTPNMTFGNYETSPQMFPLQYTQDNYNLHMVHQDSVHMHGTQSPNIGMHYQPRNNIVSSNNLGQTISPYYQSMNVAPTMLPMNGQMQSMPNVRFAVQEENVQLPETTDHETDEILRNIEQHLLGD